LYVQFDGRLEPSRTTRITAAGRRQGNTAIGCLFNAEEDVVSFGRAALSDYLAGYEGRLMRSLKSLLGTGLIDGQTEVLGHALHIAHCWRNLSAN